MELGITPDLPTGRYLLVDDQCYSGDTFDLVQEALPDLRLETAAIICHDTRYRPDYYALDTDEKVIFVYEITSYARVKRANRAQELPPLEYTCKPVYPFLDIAP